MVQINAHAVVHRNLFPDMVGRLPGAKDALEMMLATDTLFLALEEVPVDTGRLQESGHIDEDGEGVRVVFDAVNDSAGQAYGPFVEFGTVYTPAQPFLVPAAQKARDAFGPKAANIITEFLGE